MRVIEIPFPCGETLESLAERVERFADGLGVAVHRGELRSYPGCVHWHFRHPGSRGTLELTFWPDGRRFWIKVASNRESDWIEAAIAALAAHFDFGSR